jgi:hypothetical protein
MKKIFTLSVVLLFATFAFAQENGILATPDTAKQVDPNAAVMTVENETIDYGDLAKGTDDGVRVFKFKNTGKSPLLITNVKSSCGCTVPSYPKEQIMPGQSGEISVKYNMGVGRFSKSITVFTNGNPEQIVLRIKGNITDPNAAAPIQQQKSMLSN